MHEPVSNLSAVLGRYPLGRAPSTEMVPQLADELAVAQRFGRPLAVMIVRRYTDLLYAATEDAIGGAPGAEWPARYNLLAPAGRIVSDDDPAEPAVPVVDRYRHGLPFNHATLDDEIHPDIHVPAAARAFAQMRSADEAGGPAELREALDRAWFLLAFSLNTSMGEGQMFDSDLRVLEALIDGCARLYELSEETEPPAFVRDAAERDLTLRRFVWEWVTSRRYATTDGETVDEGRPTVWDAELRFPVGAVLRERFGGSTVDPADPAEAIAMGREKAEKGDFAGARRAIASALPDPEFAQQAEELLRSVVAEHACRELIAILVQYGAKTGSADHRRVVEIGTELHDLGGLGLMREVHAEFTAKRRPLSRTLDMAWDGIGSWQG